MLNSINSESSWSGHFPTCLILLVGIAQLFNPESVLGQSAISSVSARGSNVVPNSITAAQRSTEKMLSRPASSFSIGNNETLEASEFFDLLNVTVFIDINLEGSFETDDELTFRTGVSMGKALKRALAEFDAVHTVSPDGSILIISIDDVSEPEYMSTVIYDVSNLAGSIEQARRLEWFMMETVDPDGWEDNGSGNGAASIYAYNGRILMAIKQSYSTHLKVRSHLASTARLGNARSSLVSPYLNTAGSSQSVTSQPEMAAGGSQLASSVVKVPAEHTKSHRRQRRGFARPDSNLSGGLGGNAGGSGGVF